jgi:hypothetical protein
LEDPLEALDAAVAPIEQEILADLSEVFQQTGQAFDGTAEQKRLSKKNRLLGQDQTRFLAFPC